MRLSVSCSALRLLAAPHRHPTLRVAVMVRTPVCLLGLIVGLASACDDPTADNYQSAAILSGVACIAAAPLSCFDPGASNYVGARRVRG